MKNNQGGKTESDEQVEFIQWCKRNQDKYPKLKKIFAIPNGGKRHIATASRMKLEGVKSGVPDLFLPVASRGFHGLFIEMKKADGGKISKHQLEWKEMLQIENYAWVVANGFHSARRLIKSYLRISSGSQE